MIQFCMQVKDRLSKADILDYISMIKPIFLKKGIKIVGLFGSFTKGDDNIYSDIDIAIQKNKNAFKNGNIFEYFEIINEIKSSIQKNLGRNVDIFDIDSVSPFVETIKKELISV